MTLRLDPEALDHLAERGYDPVYGARPLKRVIQREILDPLAMEMLKGRFREGAAVVVGIQDGELRFMEKVAEAA